MQCRTNELKSQNVYRHTFRPSDCRHMTTEFKFCRSHRSTLWNVSCGGTPSCLAWSRKAERRFFFYWFSFDDISFRKNYLWCFPCTWRPSSIRWLSWSIRLWCSWWACTARHRPLALRRNCLDRRMCWLVRRLFLWSILAIQRLAPRYILSWSANEKGRKVIFWY